MMSYNTPHYRHVKRNLYEKGLCYFHESRLWTGPWRMQSIYPERNVFRVVKKWRTPGRGKNMSQVKNWDWGWMCFVGNTASWKEVKNKTEEDRLLTESLECLVRRLTFILLEQAFLWYHLWSLCMKTIHLSLLVKGLAPDLLSHSY